MKRGPKQTNDMQPSSKRAKHSTAANEQRPAANIAIEQIPGINRDVFQNLVFSYLNNKDLASFSATCRQARAWSRSKLQSRGLMEAVAFGNQDQAQQILEFNHDLLNDKSAVVTDCSGKKVYRLTPFQVALCAGDVEMCEMMKPYFEQLDDGQALIQQQFDAIFPKGIEAHVQAQKEVAFDFTDIIKAILNAPADEVQKALNKQFDTALPLHKALDTFRSKFTKVSHNEQIFNPQHFLKAIEQYDAAFDRAVSWDKRDLIWRQMVGFTQRFFSACCAQAAAQGTDRIIHCNEKLQRHFNFRDGRGALRPSVGEAGVGYDFAVAGARPESTGMMGSSVGPQSSQDFGFAGFISSKNIKLGKITTTAMRQPGPWCMIC